MSGEKKQDDTPRGSGLRRSIIGSTTPTAQANETNLELIEREQKQKDNKQEQLQKYITLATNINYDALSRVKGIFISYEKEEQQKLSQPLAEMADKIKEKYLKNQSDVDTRICYSYILQNGLGVAANIATAKIILDVTLNDKNPNQIQKTLIDTRLDEITKMMTSLDPKSKEYKPRLLELSERGYPLNLLTKVQQTDLQKALAEKNKPPLTPKRAGAFLELPGLNKEGGGTGRRLTM